MVKLLRDIQAKFGLSYIFISHDLQVVKALCQTILVLKNGETQAYDTTDNIFSQPQNHYVTALIAHSSESERVWCQNIRKLTIIVNQVVT